MRKICVNKTLIVMYKRRIISAPVLSERLETLRPFCPDRRIARPISYYIKGGVDLDGISDRPPLPDSFDSAEDIASDTVNIATNPRVSRLDILDYASRAYVDASAKRSAEQMTGEHVE